VGDEVFWKKKKKKIEALLAQRLLVKNHLADRHLADGMSSQLTNNPVILSFYHFTI
jgi:hypothetical protein